MSVCACVVGSRNVHVCEAVCVGLCVKEYVYLHVCVCRYAYVPANHLVVMIKINTRQKIFKGYITLCHVFRVLSISLRLLGFNHSRNMCEKKFFTS